jgi:thymidylate synthase (FAD)
MIVELVSWTTNPQEAIELAASNCYDSVPNGKIMNHCFKSGHHSVLEFAQFHFHIEGISRALSHQLVRHRTFSFAQRSQRYCTEDNFEYVTPKSIENDSIMKSEYEMALNGIKAFYTFATEHGIPNEDARFILPNACATTIDVSCDFRNLIHFMNERLCVKSQWEIRELAKKMCNCVTEVFPEAKNMLVPKCERFEIPFCTETKSCGRHLRLKNLIGDNMNKIILICGRSGSGKTTISDMLEKKYNLKVIPSYTTRPRRYEDEQGHIFISESKFDKLTDLVAYAKIGDYRYAATTEQVDTHSIYVIDPSGIETFKNNYKGNKEIVTILIDTNIGTAYERMVDRLLEQNVEFEKAIEYANKRMTDDIATFKKLETMQFDFRFENNENTNLDNLVDNIIKKLKLKG